MIQMSLELTPRRARQTDPQTSQAAAAQVERFATGQYQLILTALRAGFAPMGAEQIGAAIGLDAYAVRKRLAELQQYKLARPTDQTRTTSTGRSERLWVCV